MKRFLLTILIFSIPLLAISQSTIKGIVKSSNGRAIENAIVFVYGTPYQTKTDAQGQFTIENVSPGLYKCGVSAVGYETFYTNDFRAKANETTDLGEIKISLLVSIESAENSDANTNDDINTDLYSNESSSSILHGSRDPFADNVSYSLSSFGFRYRGYDNDYGVTLINGAEVANPENNRTTWSEWGGLNDVTRLKTISIGINPAENTFSNIGGSTDIQMIPSLFRKGLRVSYSRTNRSYRNRAMATYSTGLTSNNWAFTVSGSRRWAEEGYVQGTFYDAWAYYLGIEKRFSNQRIILNFFGAPIKRGKQGPSVQEAYDLLGNNFYNPYWGYQNGKVRNSRVANMHEPIAMLTHLWNINSKLTLNTTIVGRYGRNGSTTLNWYNAPDPRPDYYRYLPTYITNPQEAQYVTDHFIDPQYSQINWNKIYLINENSIDTVFDANGVAGNTVAGKRAQYIIEENRYDQLFVNFSTNLNYLISDNFKLKLGGHYKYYEGRNFKTLNDLLGADFWLDIDKYAERDIKNNDSSQSDLNNPNRIVKQGDVFGYKYNSYVQDARIWGQGVYDAKLTKLTFGGFAGYKNFYRYGYYQNGLFPKNSFGKSQVYSFLEFGGKINLVLKINGRNFIQANASYIKQAPDFNNVFISPRTRDLTVANPKQEQIISYDLCYVKRTPVLKLTINAFYTQFKDLSRVMSFYHDGYRNYVNYAMQGINKTHQGIELGIDGNITNSLSAYVAATVASYRYTSRPRATITVDNSAKLIAENKLLYIQNFVIPTVPQTAVTGGLRYRTKNFWSFYLNANYVQDQYLDFNPDRRTSEAVAYIPVNSELWHSIIDQQKLKSAYTIDLSVTKSWRIAHKYYLAINANFNNILDNKNIISGGFEQLRFDQTTQNPNKYPAKYFYMYGRQYFVNVSISF